MLNAPDLEFQDVLAAVEAWQPDAACRAAGDEYVALALRCYAAAGLCDAQIIRRVLDQVGIDAPDTDRYAAAVALARHCAKMDLPLNRIIAVLAHPAVHVPCFPNADDIAEIAIAALAEFAE
ncbi:MAG TPA: hypothetical protein VHT74_25560 [Acetobacteraceae bacterium]|jgi:hypothetical protein|nr:hypothetical protein [Acetobacteraceae bacterium]